MGIQFSYLEKLGCSKCGKEYTSIEPRGLCTCGSPLLASYDLSLASDHVTKESLGRRESALWRYHEILPVSCKENIVSLGEGMTPLVKTQRLGEKIDVKNLLIKDEGLIPTGTFKARGASVGVSRCRELGIKKISMPTNGNAGAAWASYAARAGIESYIVMPTSAPDITKAECFETGAHLYLVNGLINDAGAIVKEASAKYGLFDVSTFKEPYRLEGKKTMGFEIMEQMDWKQPDVIVYPTGGGVGIIGIYKALRELREMGLIDEITARLVSVQADGCAPIVKAFSDHKKESEFWKNSSTVAFGINVPKALADFMILDSLYKTNGTAISVSDDDILKYQRETARNEGLFMCPEGAATIAAVKQLRESGWIDRGENVVSLNTGSGIKYPETVKVDAPVLEKEDRIKL